MLPYCGIENWRLSTMAILNDVTPYRNRKRTRANRWHVFIFHSSIVLVFLTLNVHGLQPVFKVPYPSSQSQQSVQQQHKWPLVQPHRQSKSCVLSRLLNSRRCILADVGHCRPVRPTVYGYFLILVNYDITEDVFEAL